MVRSGGVRLQRDVRLDRSSHSVQVDEGSDDVKVER